ncbi:MAG: SURF1 family protein [Acetobacteraceae bacterium]
MLLVLLGLGTWQVRRLAWKEAILAQIGAAESMAPVPLPANPSPFQKVRVTGRFLPGADALYGVEVRDTPTGSVMGGQLLAPFAADGRVMLVDRGWVPTTATMTAPVVASPGGEVTLVGYARPAEHPRLLLGASDDIAGRLFFTLDPERIATALGLKRVAPFTFVILGPAPADGPIPAEHLPRPVNNHLSYALTWYGLAAALAVIFTTWARKRLSHDPV